ncbi:C40 family peptidase [Larsenimonas rhizosphaerae]|uniref:C40 family peptidase n=1 Tax=Larsenimonas rhizosphaerae TaxID=2944682 RepID=UPI0020339713|nr:NlpC/P60 family protein [Larsenimonas rhizosphaerae]MCM2131017.1 NlpC/P60 family protein [Larsenimonas rhizosphaerae]
MWRWISGCVLAGFLAGCATQQSSPQAHYYDVAMPSITAPKANARAKQKKPDAQTSPVVQWSTIRDSLMSEYDEWSGTPYRYGGESRSGIDCSALVQQIFSNSFDIDLPRTTLGQVLEGDKISKTALKPGDLVFFRPYRGDRHVGIYVGDGYFMHASSSSGVRLSRLDNPYWTRHYWQARRTVTPKDIPARLAMK